MKGPTSLAKVSISSCANVFLLVATIRPSPFPQLLYPPISITIALTDILLTRKPCQSIPTCLATGP